MIKIVITTLEDLAKTVDFLFALRDGKEILEQVKKLETMRIELENAVNREKK